MEKLSSETWKKWGISSQSQKMAKVTSPKKRQTIPKPKGKARRPQTAKERNIVRKRAVEKKRVAVDRSGDRIGFGDPECLQYSSSKQLDIVKEILNREQCIEDVRELLEDKMGWGNGLGELSHQTIRLLNRLRSTTLSLVESIMAWREKIKLHEKPFVWNGINYLLKISNDTNFLDDAPYLRAILGFSLVRNPFMVSVDLNAPQLLVCACKKDMTLLELFSKRIEFIQWKANGFRTERWLIFSQMRVAQAMMILVQEDINTEADNIQRIPIPKKPAYRKECTWVEIDSVESTPTQLDTQKMIAPEVQTIEIDEFQKINSLCDSISLFAQEFNNASVEPPTPIEKLVVKEAKSVPSSATIEKRPFSFENTIRADISIGQSKDTPRSRKLKSITQAKEFNLQNDINQQHNAINEQHPSGGIYYLHNESISLNKKTNDPKRGLICLSPKVTLEDYRQEGTASRKIQKFMKVSHQLQSQPSIESILRRQHFRRIRIVSAFIIQRAWNRFVWKCHKPELVLSIKAQHARSFETPKARLLLLENTILNAAARRIQMEWKKKMLKAAQQKATSTIQNIYHRVLRRRVRARKQLERNSLKVIQTSWKIHHYRRKINSSAKCIQHQWRRQLSNRHHAQHQQYCARQLQLEWKRYRERKKQSAAIGIQHLWRMRNFEMKKKTLALIIFYHYNKYKTRRTAIKSAKTIQTKWKAHRRQKTRQAKGVRGVTVTQRRWRKRNALRHEKANKLQSFARRRQGWKIAQKIIVEAINSACIQSEMNLEVSNVAASILQRIVLAHHAACIWHEIRIIMDKKWHFLIYMSAKQACIRLRATLNGKVSTALYCSVDQQSAKDILQAQQMSDGDVSFRSIMCELLDRVSISKSIAQGKLVHAMEIGPPIFSRPELIFKRSNSLQKLLESESKPNLFKIIAMSNTDDAIEKIKNSSVQLDATNPQGQSILHVLCQSCVQNKFSIANALKLLSVVLPDINLQLMNLPDADGRTCFMVSTSDATLEIMNQLAKFGADINQVDYSGVGPLELACVNKQANAIRQLLLLGADTDCMDNDGVFLIHKLVQNKNKECLEKILSAGASVDLRDSKARTPLHCAILDGRLDLVGILLGYHASPYAVDLTRRNAFHCCALAPSNNLDMFNAILAYHDPELDVQDINQNTVLHISATNGLIEICKLLLSLDASADELNIDGHTAQDAAEASGHIDCAEYINNYFSTSSGDQHTTDAPCVAPTSANGQKIEKFLDDDIIVENGFLPLTKEVNLDSNLDLASNAGELTGLTSAPSKATNSVAKGLLDKNVSSELDLGNDNTEAGMVIAHDVTPFNTFHSQQDITAEAEQQSKSDIRNADDKVSMDSKNTRKTSVSEMAGFSCGVNTTTNDAFVDKVLENQHSTCTSQNVVENSPLDQTKNQAQMHSEFVSDDSMTFSSPENIEVKNTSVISTSSQAETCVDLLKIEQAAVAVPYDNTTSRSSVKETFGYGFDSFRSNATRNSNLTERSEEALDASCHADDRLHDQLINAHKNSTGLLAESMDTNTATLTGASFCDPDLPSPYTKDAEMETDPQSTNAFAQGDESTYDIPADLTGENEFGIGYENRWDDEANEHASGIAFDNGHDVFKDQGYYAQSYRSDDPNAAYELDEQDDQEEFVNGNIGSTSYRMDIGDFDVEGATEENENFTTDDTNENYNVDLGGFESYRMDISTSACDDALVEDDEYEAYNSTKYSYDTNAYDSTLNNSQPNFYDSSIATDNEHADEYYSYDAAYADVTTYEAEQESTSNFYSTTENESLANAAFGYDDYTEENEHFE